MEKQHFEILLESMDSKINLILEGYSVLAKEIKDTRNELKEDISLLDVKISGLSKRVDTVEANLGTRIDAVEANMGARIDAVESNLGARIDAVHSELIDHRNSSEMHRVPRRTGIKKAA
jgi:DNA anti-recombination protein RmuC